MNYAFGLQEASCDDFMLQIRTCWIEHGVGRGRSGPRKAPWRRISCDKPDDSLVTSSTHCSQVLIRRKLAYKKYPPKAQRLLRTRYVRCSWRSSGFEEAKKLQERRTKEVGNGLSDLQAPSQTRTRSSHIEKLAREIPSLCIRKYRVERFTPKRAAAPFEPATTPFVCFKVLRM